LAVSGETLTIDSGTLMASIGMLVANGSTLMVGSGTLLSDGQN
jgi:hypothetical protein